MIDVKAKLRKANQMRLGFDGYCRILRSIQVDPGTGETLAERFGVNHNTMNHVLRSLYRMKLIHRREWVRPREHSVLVPIWAFGEDGDCEPEVPAPRRTSRVARGSAITLGTIFELLADDKCSMGDLAEEMGMHRETVIRLIRIMSDHKLVRIAGWRRRSTGGPIPLYGLGDIRNAARPKPQQNAKNHANTHRLKQQHIQMIHVIAGNSSVFSWARAAA